MTPEQYNQLSADLINVYQSIPLNWGAVQNDGTDKQIDMFKIHSLDELENKTANLSAAAKLYFKRRWFIWKCSQCDEYLFCLNNNVTPNPNKYDQTYDVEFNNNPTLQFDIKGTIIPGEFRNNIENSLQNPTEMVRFFYNQQSKGVRNAIQNRLFIIHHSYVSQQRELFLRCQFNTKQTIFQEYSNLISTDTPFFTFQNVKADLIFIIEELNGNITCKFHTY